MTGTNEKKEKGEKVVAKENTTPMKYYKGTYSSPFAMEVLAKMGFAPLPSGSRDWDVRLFTSKNCTYKQSSFKKMKESQRFSRFPKAEYLTQKSKLAKSFRKMTKQGATDLDFLPQTFVLPDDWKAFMKYAGEEKNSLSEKKRDKAVMRVGGPWIVKPHDAAGGHGIFLANRLADLGTFELLQLISKWKKIVVSQYISNPLLIDGLKFDLRLYVLVTSFTPLHIFFFSDGLARFCTERYPTDGNISDLLAHLTNTSLNCHSEKFKYAGETDDASSHTSRTLSSVLEHLKNEGVDTQKVMNDIYELTNKTFATIQPKVEKAIKNVVPFRRNCFQLFGLDVLIDENLKPWLLEVNGNPCLEPYTDMEVPIKARLVRDMFRIVGLHGDDSKKLKKREARRKGDFRLICPKSIQPASKPKSRSSPNSETVVPHDVVVAVPKEEVVVPKEQVVVPKEQVVVPKEQVVVPKEQVVVPKEEVIVPKEVVVPKEVMVPKEEAPLPKMEPIIAKPGLDASIAVRVPSMVPCN